MYVSPEVAELLSQAFALAENARFEYVTPELILYAACRNKAFAPQGVKGVCNPIGGTTA